MLGLLVSASGAWAAEIVEVRVGRHAEFTRVVFELDRQAGYRIERSSESDAAELVVSLEATSIPRRIQSSSALLEQVEIEPRGSRSVARIRLGKEGLKLKEMILASPPRIVLDILSDAPPAPKVAATKPTPKPAPSVKPEPKPEPVRRPVARPAPEPRMAAAKPEPPKPSREAIRDEQPPVAVARNEEPAPRPTPPQAQDRTPDRPGVERRVVPEPMRPEPTRAPTTTAGDELAATDGREVPPDPWDREGSPGTEAAERPSAADRALERMNRQAQPKPAAKPPAKPMIARTKAPKESEGGGWMTWAMVGVGLVLLGGAGFLFARRNNAGGNAGEEVDFSDGDDAGETAAGELDDAPVPVDENPFAGMDEQGDQMNLAPSDEATMPALMDHDDDATVIVDDLEKEAETVVFDDGSEGETMDVISRDQVNESLGEMPPVGGVSEEIAQMMRSMERRVQALEGRIDELVDARDRLERQVAAQTEELRVQRAAIARTQRAVRNLARPEDEVAPEEATEPALRDPNKPSMDS